MQLQLNDSSLVKLFVLSMSVRDLNGASEYSLCDGVLVRTLCNRNLPSDMPIKQIVVPTPLRQKLILVAHNSIPSGIWEVRRHWTMDRLQSSSIDQQ